MAAERGLEGLGQVVPSITNAGTAVVMQSLGCFCMLGIWHFSAANDSCSTVLFQVDSTLQDKLPVQVINYFRYMHLVLQTC